MLLSLMTLRCRFHHLNALLRCGLYVSGVKITGRFGLVPSLFPQNGKPCDVFHSLSPAFMKYMRNKIKALFVLLVHKMVEIVYSSLWLTVKHFLLSAALFLSF